MKKAVPYILSVLLVVVGSAGSFYLSSIMPVEDQPAPASVSASPDSREMMTEDFLVSLLFPDLIQAVNGYYGKPTEFGSARILNIQRLPYGQYYFEITVQVETFHGPHSPPYGFQTPLPGSLPMDNTNMFCNIPGRSPMPSRLPIV